MPGSFSMTDAELAVAIDSAGDEELKHAIEHFSEIRERELQVNPNRADIQDYFNRRKPAYVAELARRRMGI